MRIIRVAFLISLLFIFPHLLKSQIKEIFFIRIGGEVSIPTGRLADKTTDPMHFGMAKLGGVENFHFGVRLHKYLGVTAGLMYSSWSVDRGDLLLELKNIPKDNGDSTFYSNTILNTDNWRNLSVIGGFYTSIKINKKNTISTSFKLMAGYSNTTLPDIWTIEGVTYERPQQRVNSACYLAGFDFRVDPGPYWAIILHFEYFYANPTFSNAILIRNYILSVSDVNIPVSSFNIGIGFAVKI